jgi:DNA-binding GntR family transcriptional regulator
MQSVAAMKLQVRQLVDQRSPTQTARVTLALREMLLAGQFRPGGKLIRL